MVHNYVQLIIQLPFTFPFRAGYRWLGRILTAKRRAMRNHNTASLLQAGL